ncbi:MAG: TonB-dependent receptor [Polyangiales bacterium]
MFGRIRLQRGRAASVLRLPLTAASLCVFASISVAQPGDTPTADPAPVPDQAPPAAGGLAPSPVPTPPAAGSAAPAPTPSAAGSDAPLPTPSAAGSEAPAPTPSAAGSGAETPAAPPPSAAATPADDASTDPRTGIRGRIVDRKAGTGLELATVMVSDGATTRTAVTTTHGAYELKLPPGVYKVRAYYDLYHGATLPNVRVSRGKFNEVNLLLDAVDEDEDVVVESIEIPYRADTTTAAAQDELRKAASGIGEGMGAAQMSQSGSSDAGSAAKRVVGVSVEGANLVIRGLGGRYSRVYLNGDPIPSTDPDRPSVDLDLFPTSVIDSMTVSKTFLPYMPADFAGGVLEIKTITFPKDFTFQLGLSGEYSSQTTFKKYLDYKGGSYDALGFDDGTRSLPSSIPNEAVKVSRNGRFTSLQDLERIGESFPNRWQYQRSVAPPSPGVDLTLGDSFNLPGKKRFGYMVSASYDYKVRRITGLTRKIGVDGPDADNLNDIYSDYPTVEFGSQDVQLSAIGTASLDLGIDHSLTFLSMFNRSGSDETGYRAGIDGEISRGDPVEKWQLQYVGRTMWFNQLLGDHRNLLGTTMRLRWGAYYSLSARDEPDRRNVTYLEEGPPEMRELRWRQGYAERFYSGLDGKDLGGNLSLRIPLWSDAFATVGGSIRSADRDFWIRRFRFVKLMGDHSDDVYGRPPEELFSEEGIGTITRLDNEPTRNNDGFTAKQTVYTAYGMVETPLFGKLSFSGGARAEIYSQKMQAKSPFPIEDGDGTTMADRADRADRTDVNVLPAASFKYELGSGMLLRAAYGMTVGRPQARELAPFIYYDFLRDRNIVGDLDLRTTLIHNGDLRWEWFFAQGQVVSLSLFYKNFRRPIEQQIIAVDGSSTFTNTPSAESYGAELELRSSLEHISPALKLFEFGGNLTLLRSQVEIPADLSGAVRSGSRRMFGQAPYVINLALRFADPDTHLSAGVVYNVVGPRIIDVGIRAGDGILPDIEEQPFHAVDFIAGWEVSKHLKLKAKWRNILLQTRRLQQGPIQILRADPGTFVTLGVDYTY